MKVPVAILIFNRPGCVARLLPAIARYAPERLYVIADGARPGRAGESEAVAAARGLVESAVTWPCTVHRDYADRNLGCGGRVQSGLARVFEREETAIVIEDDCIPTPAFFAFCERALARYRDDPAVAMVSGWSFLRPGEASQDVYLSPWCHIWGWATWRDRWRNYDPGFRAWLDEAADGRRVPGLTPAMQRRWSAAFARVRAGEIDTWDYQWQALCLARGWRCLTPAWSLVENVGLGAAATHTAHGSHLHRTPRDVVPALPAAIDRAESDRLARRVWDTAINPSRARRLLGRIAALANRE